MRENDGIWIAFLISIISSNAFACDLPTTPGSTQAEVETYLRNTDTYLVCERKLADEGKPLARKAAYTAYLNAFASMQKAVDRYNAALASMPPQS